MTAIDKIARYIFLAVVWIGAFGVIMPSLRNSVFIDIPSIFMFAVATILSYGVTWQPSGNLDKLMRYGLLVMIWFGLIAVGNTASYYAPASLTVLSAIVLTFFASYFLFPRYPAVAAKAESPQHDLTEKRKNGSMDALNPLDILTTDDLYDLRQEIKDEIRTRIFSGSEGELSSLDALLDAQDRKTTRK